MLVPPFCSLSLYLSLSLSLAHSISRHSVVLQSSTVICTRVTRDFASLRDFAFVFHLQSRFALISRRIQVGSCAAISTKVTVTIKSRFLLLTLSFQVVHTSIVSLSVFSTFAQLDDLEYLLVSGLLTAGFAMSRISPQPLFHSQARNHSSK
jgi:hypothetical protein